MNLTQRIVTLAKSMPRVAILMSGKGSNAEIILQKKLHYPNFHFVTILTDKLSSNAEKIADKYRLDYCCVEAKDKTPFERNKMFKSMTRYLTLKKVDLLIYAGFMKIVPAAFLKKFPGINIHPADLTLLDEKGSPKYAGMRAVEKAMRAGETSIASSIHVVAPKVDCGEVLYVSKPLELSEYPNYSAEKIQEKLKMHCEHHAYPEALRLLAEGKILDKQAEKSLVSVH